MVLEFVSGAVKTLFFQHFSSLTRLKVSRGPMLAERHRKTDPNISSQMAFRYPVYCLCFTAGRHIPVGSDLPRALILSASLAVVAMRGE